MKYSIDWVKENQIIMWNMDGVVWRMAWSSSWVYLSNTLFSMASDETVRIAVTASDAMDALVEKRLPISASILVSRRMRAYPASSMGGIPAKTPTKPSFQEMASDRTAGGGKDNQRDVEAHQLEDGLWVGIEAADQRPYRVLRPVEELQILA
jgi:hypothetical protein